MGLFVPPEILRRNVRKAFLSMPEAKGEGEEDAAAAGGEFSVSADFKFAGKFRAEGPHDDDDGGGVSSSEVAPEPSFFWVQVMPDSNRAISEQKRSRLAVIAMAFGTHEELERAPLYPVVWVRTESWGSDDVGGKIETVQTTPYDYRRTKSKTGKGIERSGDWAEVIADPVLPLDCVEDGRDVALENYQGGGSSHFDRVPESSDGERVPFPPHHAQIHELRGWDVESAISVQWRGFSIEFSHSGTDAREEKAEGDSAPTLLLRVHRNTRMTKSAAKR